MWLTSLGVLSDHGKFRISVSHSHPSPKGWIILQVWLILSSPHGHASTAPRRQHKELNMTGICTSCEGVLLLSCTLCNLYPSEDSNLEENIQKSSELIAKRKHHLAIKKTPNQTEQNSSKYLHPGDLICLGSEWLK